MVLSPRVRLTLLAAVLCAAAAVLGVQVADGGDPRLREGAAVPGFVGSKRPPGIPPQDFALTDQDGTETTLAQYRGTPVVLTFLYSTCEDTCPQQVQAIRGALDLLGRDVPVLAVSVDPRNDTAVRARRFVARERMTGRMRFLLGDRSALQPIWKHYGIQPQGDAFEHSAYVVLVDRKGRQRIGFPVSQLTPEGLEHDLRMLLAE